MACIIFSCSAAASTLALVSADSLPTQSSSSGKSTPLLWVSSFPRLNISINSNSLSIPPNLTLNNKNYFIQASKKPNRKSWKQRTDMYMRPFLLNVFFSKSFIHAKVMHRRTSKVISVATTNAKDIRSNLPSLTDHNACRVIGKLIAERS